MKCKEVLKKALKLDDAGLIAFEYKDTLYHIEFWENENGYNVEVYLDRTIEDAREYETRHGCGDIVGYDFPWSPDEEGFCSGDAVDAIEFMLEERVSGDDAGPASICAKGVTK